MVIHLAYIYANIRKKTELTMRSERKKQIYLHFSEPQGRKACVAGLKRKTENFTFFVRKTFNFYLCTFNFRLLSLQNGLAP